MGSQNKSAASTVIEQSSLIKTVASDPFPSIADFSRRKFLKAGSAALVGSALAALNARAQSRDSVEAGEHDHSASDPGPEDKPVLDANLDVNMPPSSDSGDMPPLWYSFDLVKKRIEEGGWTHEVTQRELSPSKDIAGVNMRLTAGSFRELHWHTADEWSYVLYGNARVTVMEPSGKIFIGDVSEGDTWIFPAGYPHSIQGLDPDGTEFLLVFNQGDFSEDGTMLLSEFVATTPTEVLMKNMNLSKEEVAKFPTKPLYIFPSKVPTNTVEQDQAEAGEITERKFTFKFRQSSPFTISEGGEMRILDSRNFPVSQKIAAVLNIIKPGHVRELHWHPNASEWQYWIKGKGRMTVFFPVGNARTVDFRPNDVGYVPPNAGHYLENTGDEDVVSLEMFATDVAEYVSLNQWLRRVPVQVVQAHLGIDAASIAKIPNVKSGEI